MTLEEIVEKSLKTLENLWKIRKRLKNAFHDVCLLNGTQFWFILTGKTETINFWIEDCFFGDGHTWLKKIPNGEPLS